MSDHAESQAEKRGSGWFSEQLPYFALAALVLCLAVFAVFTTTRGKEAAHKAKTEAADSAIPIGSTPVPAANTAQGVAMRILLYLQAGAVYVVREYYSTRAQNIVGRRTMVRALMRSRTSLGGQHFKVLLVERRGRSVSVLVRAVGPQGEGKVAFALQKTGGRYEVLADTLVGNEIADVVAQAARGTGAGVKAAAERGRRAAERYHLP